MYTSYQQVYVALLRSYQNEYRELVHVALDTLVPALPKRLRSDDFVKAMKWTKKIIFEEGHVLSQLAHVWHLVIRHADLFYPFRSHFISQIISTISRLGLSPNCPVEHRKIALGCVEILIGWEFIRQKKKELRVKYESKERENSVGTVNSGNTGGNAGSNIPGNTGSGSTSSSTNSKSITSDKEEDYCLHYSMGQMLSNFLVRLGLFVADSKDKQLSHLSTKCMELYNKLYLIIPLKNIDVSYFEKLLQTFLDSSSNSSSNASSGSSSSGNTAAATGAATASSGGQGNNPTSVKVKDEDGVALGGNDDAVTVSTSGASSKPTVGSSNNSATSKAGVGGTKQQDGISRPSNVPFVPEKVMCTFLQFLSVSINTCQIGEQNTLLLQNSNLIQKLFQSMFSYDNLLNSKLNFLFRLLIVKVDFPYI